LEQELRTARREISHLSKKQDALRRSGKSKKLKRSNTGNSSNSTSEASHAMVSNTDSSQHKRGRHTPAPGAGASAIPPAALGIETTFGGGSNSNSNGTGGGSSSHHATTQSGNVASGAAVLADRVTPRGPYRDMAIGTNPRLRGIVSAARSHQAVRKANSASFALSHSRRPLTKRLTSTTSANANTRTATGYDHTGRTTKYTKSGNQHVPLVQAPLPAREPTLRPTKRKVNTIDRFFH
jgi:hypothetical protein